MGLAGHFQALGVSRGIPDERLAKGYKDRAFVGEAAQVVFGDVEPDFLITQGQFPPMPTRFQAEQLSRHLRKVECR